MSRQAFKTITNTPVEFIPSKYKNDQTLSKDAALVKDRPMIMLVKKLTREDRLNLQFIAEFKPSKANALENVGSVTKFMWDRCVVEVKNVLMDEDGQTKEYESVTGVTKNALFETSGIDEEIAECINFIQEISTLSDAEAKN